MSISLSEFAGTLTAENAFVVLARAKALQRAGKDVVELQIGDSPFPSTAHAKQAGLDAIAHDESHYCPSAGLWEFRETVVQLMHDDYGVSVQPANVVIGAGAKIFQQFFCEAVLNPGDEVLVFSPAFPTYLPNIERRRAVMLTSVLKEEHDFRPSLDDVAAFLDRPRAKAVFLNSPHNPTGGVATEDDLRGLADLLRGRNIALFSDEPYNHMAWRGRHFTPLQQPGMLEQCMAAYTFSKSYSMSGWRVGFAVGGEKMMAATATMVNTSLSCVPPIVQRAAIAALKHDAVERDHNMARFREKVMLLSDALARVPGVRVRPPAGAFYVFPNVTRICNALGMTSHGFASFLLEGADDAFGVACLGGECFGAAGAGFLRLSCSEPDERLVRAVDFLATAALRRDRAAAYLATRPEFRLTTPYPEPTD
ncbi:MAG: pyridoxal phosphate-dependent aminotransferase [Planctomycetia bacterium]